MVQKTACTGDRIVEAAVAILHYAAGRSMNITNLNKALFYLDLFALRDLGESVTRSAYIAKRNGPVLADYKKTLIKALADRKLARQESSGQSKPVTLEDGAYERLEKQMPESVHALAGHLSKRLGAVFAIVASEYSHENPGWQIAWADGRFPWQRKPIDMNIALQQLINDADDPWLSSSDDEDVRDAMNRSQSRGARSQVWHLD